MLDDYHLADGAGIAQGMTFLVEHLPPNARLVLSTRADPDLPLARWRARGELLEIRAADLRFTSDETSTYLSGATSARLTAEQVGALEDRTEGWIAALQLAAISLRRHDDVAGFIAGFAGDDRYVVDYLVEEVLAQQPPAVRDFLLRSAVLDRLCGPLCDAVVGTADAGRVLLDIERANLFLLALDDRRQWYRYHQLFSDVLRAHLVAEQPDLVPVLHRRASLWHEEHNLTDAAIMHALKAKDFDRAAFLMEMAVPEIRRRRQEAKVHGWLMALPEETVRRRPVLSVFSAALSMVAGDLDAVGSRLDDAERALAADNDDDSVTAWADTEELRTLPATIAIYRASLAQAHGDVADTVRHAQDALDQSGPHDHLSRGAAAGFLGLAAWADGEVSRALETFEQAVVSLHAAGNVIDELSGAVVLADLWRATGRPSTARELCEWALGKAEAHGEPMCRAAAELHVALSELDLEAGDLDSARRHLASAHDLIGRTPLTESHFRYFVASALVSGAEGDLEGAIAHLNRAEQLYRPGFFPDVRPIPAIRARVRIRQGRLDAASDWARERDVSTTGPAHYLREFDHLTLVRLLLVENRTRPGTDEVTLLLERLWENAETSGRAESLLEIAVLTALHHDAQGRRTQAMTALAEAFALAPEPEAHVRLFLDEGEPMVALLRAADQDGLAGA
ncbi:MAG: helix-turn-helix transcriptional regulator, partial [Ornithinibacter sp.]